MVRKARLPDRDRRGPNRPANGDVKVCPACGGACEFNERYRFDGQMAPAWRCDSPQCRRAELVRASTAVAPETRELITKARRAQASAKRTMMKARAVHQRSEKVVADSVRTVRRSRRGGT